MYDVYCSFMQLVCEIIAQESRVCEHVRERERKGEGLWGKCQTLYLYSTIILSHDSVVSSMMRYQRVCLHVLKLIHLQRTSIVYSRLSAL